MPIRPYFTDRRQAGRMLAERLDRYANRPADVLVLALPRGGVPVAYEIARARSLPLDVFVVRKLGAPHQPELAMGAIASGGARVLNTEVIEGMGIDGAALDRVMATETRELHDRERRYRGDRPPPAVAGRTAILIDDGIATGATMRAAIAAVRTLGPARVVVAAPVGEPSTLVMLDAEADEVVCLIGPTPFRAVGEWYKDFSQTTDAEVRELLAAAATPAPGQVSA